MPTSVQYLCGAPSTPYIDGQPYQPRMGRMGDTIVSEFRGKYGEANSRGQVFHYGTLVAGVTLPIFTATAQTAGLRNPPNSGVVLELIRLEIGYLSGTQVPGSLVFCVPPTVNPGITATGTLAVAVATFTNGQSGQLAGSGPQPKSRCGLLTAVTTTAPTVILRNLGLSTYTMPATNATQGVTYTGYVFDGTDLLYPGADLFLACTVAAGAGVNCVNFIGLELPYNGG